MGQVYNSREEYLKSKGDKSPEVSVGQPQVSVKPATNHVYNSKEEYENSKKLANQEDRNSEFYFDSGMMVDNFMPSLKKEGAEI